MPRSLIVLAVGLMNLTGCAHMTETASSTAVPPQSAQADIATVHRMDNEVAVMDPEELLLDLNSLQAGQRVRLVTSSATMEEMKRGGSVDTVEYIGTIETIDQNQIVLKEASLLIEARSTRSTPVLGRVPYVSRLFKSTSIAHEMQALPDPVTISRSKLVVALPPETQFHERIGVDFDYSAGHH